MKKVYYGLVVLGLGLFAGILYSASYNLTVPDAHATIITNRVTLLNLANGTSLTVLGAVDKYGASAITNNLSFSEITKKERQKKDRLILSNYYNAAIGTKNSVDSTLGISD